MNNRRFILLICFILAAAASFAQAGNKVHVLQKGETLSMLATKYHTTVGDIMRLNNMHQDTKLVTGGKIKIPQSSNTASVPEKTVAKAIPVKPAPVKASSQQTHVVKQGETLFAISKMYGVTVDQIKTWNNLTTDNVNEGQQLVINSNATVTANKTTSPAYAPAPDNNADKPVVSEQQTTLQNQPVDTAMQQPATVDANNKTDNINNNTAIITAPVQPAPVNTNNTNINPASVGPEGFFASLFGVDVQQRSLKTIEGVSMTFKTASGWADKKYYILMNDVPPGSIVKVVANNKTIYAKVLWSLGDMKENEGLQFRISNAASAALGIADQKFNLTVFYYE